MFNAAPCTIRDRQRSKARGEDLFFDEEDELPSPAISRRPIAGAPA
jgi:hypothetical protein